MPVLVIALVLGVDDDVVLLLLILMAIRGVGGALLAVSFFGRADVHGHGHRMG